MKNLGFHFTAGMKLRDGQELIEGKEYVYEGEIKICESGYHLSRKLLDALRYSPGFTLSLVEFNEIVEEQEDKLVCRRRKVIETHDVREIILTWACDIAEDALNKFWNISDDLRPYEAIKAARECIKNPSVAIAYAAVAAANAAFVAYAAAFSAAPAAYAAAYAAYAAYAAAYAAYAAYAAACAADSAAACDALIDDAHNSAHNSAYSAAAAACAHAAANAATRVAAHAAACDDIEVLLIQRLQKVFKNNLTF